MAEGGIYQIRNLINGNLYVGSAQNLCRRQRVHFSHLQKNKHENTHLQRAYNLHGEDVFVFEVLESVKNKTDLIKVEQKYLDELSPRYNICKFAGSTLGNKCTEETKQKLSLKRISLHLSGEKSFLYGKKQSEEHKQNLSNAMKGKPSPNLGKHYSDEVKLRMSKRMMGVFAKEKHPMWGVHHTQEYKDKMAISQKGISAGIKNPNSKLTEIQVAEIKKLIVDGLTQTEIGRMFNVSQHAIWNIKTSRTWAHIEAYCPCKAVV